MFKRFIAFIIDLVIVMLVCNILNIIAPNKKIDDYNHELNTYNEQMLNHEIGLREYVSDYTKVSYKIDKANILGSGITIMLFIIYFII